MYLLVGANGYLGSYILKTILEETQEDVVATFRNIEKVNVNNGRVKWVECDISNIRNIESLKKIVNQYNQKCKIVFLAAYHHPDKVDENPRLAWNINITSLSVFLNTMENVECLFYPSTDSVYGESIDGYHFKETDSLNPVNIYGRQKVAAEALVNAYGYNVVRYPFLIAPSLLKHKKHFYDYIVEDLKKGEKIEMFADSIRSSLDFGTAAKLLIQLMENYTSDIPKILNLSGDFDLSKYDIGLMLAQKYNLSLKQVVPISIEGDNGIFKAKRAQSTLMDNTLLKDTLKLSSIQISL